MLKFKMAGCVASTLFCSMAFAGTLGTYNDAANYHVYAGLGGGYNSIAVDSQLYALSTLNTYNLGILQTFGSTSGYSNPLTSSDSLFSPQVQLGFHTFFTDRNYWGVKASYQFLNGHAVTYDVPIAQYGTYLNANTGFLSSNTFAGYVLAESTEVNTNHQMNLFALIGHSFDNCNLYLGAGPTVFGVQSKINDALSYTNMNGVMTLTSDYPVSYSKSLWSWGGGAQLGMTYYFSSSWFLDFNYTYAATPSTTINNSLYAVSKRPIFGVSSTGTLDVNTTQSLSVQAFAVTANKTFDF